MRDAREDWRHSHEFVVNARKVRSRTCPRPVLSPRHQPGANRIEADIAGGSDQVILIHCNGCEALLKQVAVPAASRVDEGRVPAVCVALRSTCGRRFANRPVLVAARRVVRGIEPQGYGDSMLIPSVSDSRVCDSSVIMHPVAVTG